MANNLATGIGLSGQFQLTNEGAQAKLAAERDLYGKRQAEKAAAEKERQKRLSKIMEDSVFSTALKTPRLQREWEEMAAGEFDSILQVIEEGGNGYTESAKRLNKFKQYTNAIKAQDDALQGALEMASENPNAYGFNDEVEWNGKVYKNWYQMFNDPNVDIEKDFKNAYTGADYAFVENAQLGREMFMWNPSKRMNEQDIIKSINPEMFTQIYEENIVGPAGKKNFAVRRTGLSEANAEAFVQGVLNDPQYAGLLTSWEDEITREARQEDPTITRAQLRSSGEMGNRMAQKAEQFRQTVKSLRTAPVQMQNQFDPVKEDKKGWQRSGDQLKNDAWAITPLVRDIDFEDRKFQMEGVKTDWLKDRDQKKAIINLPDGTIFFDSEANATTDEFGNVIDAKGQAKEVSRAKTGEGKNIEGKISGVYRSKQGDDQNWYVAINAKKNENIAASDNWNTFYIPAKNRQELITVASQLGMTEAEMENLLSEAFDGGEQEKLTERQSNALAAFEKQMGRTPSESEKEKILNKYK